MSEVAGGERIILRDRIHSDLELQLRWFSTGEWRSYDAPWEIQHLPQSAEEIHKFRERFLESCRKSGPSPRRRAIIVARDGGPIGWVNRYGDERFSEACCIGVSICEDSHLNAGLGTEALGLWVDHLFGESGFHRIGLDTWSLNPRMCRVAEKLGFSLEGTERELMNWEGKWLDRYRFGLLRKEWERTR